ncbi:MAG: hypothetical protein AVDCRST_MAG08-1114 [uncultured Acetobacteraceae bacterium]|uniref:Uncharacterized protein n=1 Tax=uncultured Acetobacteraceae bacterium TaxID=169975 RepID=A0A6J4HQW0_9PROT|nr:MAG: hypothetical protein AVDCRST_MAG08-1114 [uncultured Acetobacteraceae bacterium]
MRTYWLNITKPISYFTMPTPGDTVATLVCSSMFLLRICANAVT